MKNEGKIRGCDRKKMEDGEKNAHQLVSLEKKTHICTFLLDDKTKKTNNTKR